MKKLYNFLKIKLCYRTYWKQWLAFLTMCLLVFACSDDANTKKVKELIKKDLSVYKELGANIEHFKLNVNKIVEGDKLWKEYNLKEEKNRVYYYVEEILEMTKDDGTIKKGDKMKNEQIIKFKTDDSGNISEQDGVWHIPISLKHKKKGESDWVDF